MSSTHSLTDHLNDFFDMLFEPDDLVEVRFLPPMKTKSNQWFLYPGGLVHDFEEIEDRNKRQDVYFGVNPRSDRNGRAESIKTCRCIVADFDHTTPDAAMETIRASGLPDPTILLNSGHGAHAYWRLEDPIDPQQWRSVQRGIIELLKCDDKIHDLPRIMRMPGTSHYAKHKAGTPRTFCEFVFNRKTVHDIEDIVRHLPVAKIEYDGGEVPSLPEGERGPLPTWAKTFLVEGATSGDRNSKCFGVACCMKGAGWSIEDAKTMILAAAERCDPPMDQGEALQAIKSAYAQERSPATPDPNTLEVGSAWQLTGQRPAAEPVAPVPVDDSEYLQVGEPIKVRPEGATRALISNVVENKDKEGNEVCHAKTVQQVVASVHEATGDWPRRAGGMLFVPGQQALPGELPDQYATRRLVKCDELFAWVQAEASLYWPDAKKCVDQLDGSSRTALKRVELFEHMRETLTPSYDAAEILPHEPPAANTWYAPCRLPKGDRSIIKELSGKLNWHTDLDRGLLEAALLTLFWGGGCGERPAFVLSSEFGAGAGKTTTVEMLTRVVGGHMEMQDKESSEEFAKRLLSDGALSQRAILMDNVKSKVNIAGIEAMVTAREISGHRMYYGHATRPNRLVWFVTANAPQLSHDFAERSMNIHIGAQRANAKWRADLQNWIDIHRAEIIAACLEMLRGEDASPIEEHNLDRWASWQAGVLAKVDNGNEIAAMMRDRRRAMDSDRDDAEEISMIIRTLIRMQGGDPDSVKAFIDRRVLIDALKVWQGEDDSMNRRAAATYINNRVGNGSLKQAKRATLDGYPGYSYVGEACIDPKAYTVRVTALPADFNENDVRISNDKDVEGN